ncbi:MAG: hypothetical protein ACRDN0_23880, partial [Trebonia sp.]
MHAPILIGELEITEPIPGLSFPERADGQEYTGALLLVRFRRIPVGYAFLPAGGRDLAALDSESTASRVWALLSAAINKQCARAGLAPLDSLPSGGIQAVG